MSSIYKNGEWWYYQTVVSFPDGSKKKIQRSLKTKDRKVGVKKQKDLDSKFLTQQIHLNHRLLFKEKVDEFLQYRTKRVSHGEITKNTLRSDKGSLRVFMSFLGDQGVTYLNEFEDRDRSQELLELFMETRRSVPVSGNTIRRDLRHVSGFFTYCVQHPRRWLDRNPVSDVNLPRVGRQTKYPNQKDWERLRDHLRTRSSSNDFSLFEQILWFQIETGCRIGEVLRLKWDRDSEDHVGLGESWTVVENDGNRLRLYSKRRERTIPLDQLHDGRLSKFLKTRHLLSTNGKFVFPSPVTGNPLNISQFSRSFRRLLIDLKITPLFGTHGIRHGFISYLINHGVSSDQVGWLVGHSSSEITRLYSHVDEGTLSKVLSTLK